jgi:hypothetical protein
VRHATPHQRRKALEATEVVEFTPSAHVETLRDRMERGTYTKVGWIPPPHLSDEGWLKTGITMLDIWRAAPWFLADWYATRTAAEAEHLLKSDWEGPAVHTLQNYASVAMAYPHSRRRENISFAHHAELVALPEAMQDELLDWCASPQRPSVRELRLEKARRLAPPALPIKLSTPPSALPSPRPSVIESDAVEPPEGAAADDDAHTADGDTATDAVVADDGAPDENASDAKPPDSAVAEPATSEPSLDPGDDSLVALSPARVTAMVAQLRRVGLNAMLRSYAASGDSKKEVARRAVFLVAACLAQLVEKDPDRLTGAANLALRRYRLRLEPDLGSS